MLTRMHDYFPDLRRGFRVFVSFTDGPRNRGAFDELRSGAQYGEKF